MSKRINIKKKNKLISFITGLSFYLPGCFDVHDNPVEIDMDICEAIESIKSAIKTEPPERGEMKPAWTSCTYNEECELGLCMCEICVDPSKFIVISNN